MVEQPFVPLPPNIYDTKPRVPGCRNPLKWRLRDSRRKARRAESRERREAQETGGRRETTDEEAEPSAPAPSPSPEPLAKSAPKPPKVPKSHRLREKRRAAAVAAGVGGASAGSERATLPAEGQAVGTGKYELRRLSVGELKRRLAANDIKIPPGLCEKAELVDLLVGEASQVPLQARPTQTAEAPKAHTPVSPAAATSQPAPAARSEPAVDPSCNNPLQDGLLRRSMDKLQQRLREIEASTSPGMFGQGELASMLTAQMDPVHLSRILQRAKEEGRVEIAAEDLLEAMREAGEATPAPSPPPKTVNTPLASRLGKSAVGVSNQLEVYQTQMLAAHKKQRLLRLLAQRKTDDLPPLEPECDSSDDDSMPPLVPCSPAEAGLVPPPDESAERGTAAGEKAALPTESVPSSSWEPPHSCTEPLAKILEEAEANLEAGDDKVLDKCSSSDSGDSMPSFEDFTSKARQPTREEGRDEQAEEGRADCRLSLSPSEGSRAEEQPGRQRSTSQRPAEACGPEQPSASGEEASAARAPLRPALAPQEEERRRPAQEEEKRHTKRVHWPPVMVEYQEESPEALQGHNEQSLQLETARLRLRERSTEKWQQAAASASQASSAKNQPRRGQPEQRRGREEAPAPGVRARRNAQKPPNQRLPHAHVAILGHKASGKSTLFGAILRRAGAWDEEDLAEHVRSLASGQMRRGESIEVQRCRFTFLDVPGSRSCLPDAVLAAAEADMILLAVSASGQEFEQALQDREGSLREHIRIAGGLGARAAVVALTKMADVNWSQDRVNTLEDELRPLLENAGFKPEDTIFLPVDAEEDDLDEGRGLLDSLCTVAGSSLDLIPNGPCRVLVLKAAQSRDGWLTVAGRVDSGTAAAGTRYWLAPGTQMCTVDSLRTGGHAVQEAVAGDAVELRLRGDLDLVDLPCGSVVAGGASGVKMARRFKAWLLVLDAHQHHLSVGFRGTMHIHAFKSQCELVQIQDAKDKLTGMTTERPKVLREWQKAEVLIQADSIVPMEPGGRLGRFLLRSEGSTIGRGRITAVDE